MTIEMAKTKLMQEADPLELIVKTTLNRSNQCCSPTLPPLIVPHTLPITIRRTATIQTSTKQPEAILVADANGTPH